MAIVTTGTGITTTIPISSRRQTSIIYGLVNFLRTTVGWTVDGSSDGATGGIGLSVWTSIEAADSNTSWIVLGSPDDSLQILFSRVNSGLSSNWRILYNPNADFAGGSSITEPSASVVHLIMNYNPWSVGGTPRIHISANNIAPYSFFMTGHETGSFVTRSSFLFWSTEGGYPGVDPHLFFAYNGAIDSNNLSRIENFPYIVGIHLNGTPMAFPFLFYRDSAASGNTFPKGVPATASGDPVVPVVVARTSPPSMFHGISKELMWCGVSRSTGDTLNNGQYLVWDDILIPWVLPVPTVS